MVGAIIAAAVGIVLGIGGKYVYEKQQVASGKNKIEKDLAHAKQKASDIVLKAKDEALAIEKERRREWTKTEDRLAERETSLDRKLDELDKRAEKLRAAEDEVDELKNEIREIRTRQQEKLEKLLA